MQSVSERDIHPKCLTNYVEKYSRYLTFMLISIYFIDLFWKCRMIRSIFAMLNQRYGVLLFFFLYAH